MSGCQGWVILPPAKHHITEGLRLPIYALIISMSTIKTTSTMQKHFSNASQRPGLLNGNSRNSCVLSSHCDFFWYAVGLLSIFFVQAFLVVAGIFRCHRSLDDPGRLDLHQCARLYDLQPERFVRASDYKPPFHKRTKRQE